MIEIKLDRRHGDFGFDATDANGHIIRLDSNPESGGENYGVRPMQMLLIGLGGCSGIDVVSILKKQRQEIKHFHITVKGEREQGKEATIWKEIKITFELSGPIDEDKARRACELSIEKYCSVAETLRRAGGNITWDVKVIHE